jgi:ribonuclease Z
MVDLVILGTGSMVPTKERNVQAFYLEFNGEGMLFDCGEGTQRQMNLAGISRAKVRRIFLTHWHGDHVAGLIGLIQTIGNSNYEGTLSIYGPKGTKERMFHLMNATVFENKVEIAVHELAPKDGEELFFLDNEKHKVGCVKVDHTTPTIGYAWHEKERTRVDMATCAKLGLKEGPLVGRLSRGEPVEHDGKRILPEDVTFRVAGKKIAFIPDTQLCEGLPLLAHYADVLVCESTYYSRELDKADGYKHLTAAQAAQVASQADAKRLILTHFSQRYASVEPLLEEARTVFPNTDAAFDLMKITL